MGMTAFKKIPRSCLAAGLLTLGLIAPLGAQENHIVDANQTLYSISRIYGVSTADLMSWNHLSTPTLRLGQKLIVKPETISPAAQAPVLAQNQYTVQQGDSLSELALHYGTTTQDLRRLNGLAGDQIRPGQRLYIRQPLGVITYAIQSGDSLGLVASRFNISIKDLVSINQLPSQTVKTGQLLRVYKPKEVPLTHEVLAMDSLKGLASLYNMSEDEIRKNNGLSGNSLRVGSILQLRNYAAAAGPAVFARQLSSHAANNPTGPSVVSTTPVTAAVNVAAPAVSIPATAAAPSGAETRYTVLTGDTLYKISRLFAVKVSDLISWNQLTKKTIQAGQILVIRGSTAQMTAQMTAQTAAEPARAVLPETPPMIPAGLSRPAAPISFPVEAEEPQATPETEQPSQVKNKPVSSAKLPDFEEKNRERLSWDSLVVLDKSIPLFEWNNDYYYWSHPGEVSQPSRGYYENDWDSPLDAYKKAKKLWEGFSNLVEKRPQITSLLAGYTVVLDPGHGGLDPGAIVKSTDGTGDTLYVTEDEYVYDIALRMYVLLKEHGANVQITTMAPNHLIRDTTPATRTLIHEKNEVYNSLELNKDDKNDCWIAGGPKGLEKRVDLAAQFFKKTPVGKRIFISLHSDNDPRMPMGTGVLSFERDGKVDSKSKSFGDALLPYLGKGSYSRTEDLGVLRNNPADYKALVEVRNVAYPEHSWALRFANTRQLDAQKIVRGILEYFDR